MKRVVITGMALISSLGNSIKDAFLRLQKFENCVEYMKALDEYDKMQTRLAAPVKNFETPKHFTRKITRSMGKVAIYSVACAEEALKDAGLLGNEIITSGQTGVSFGSSSGSLDAIIDFYSMTVDKEVKNVNSGSYLKMMPQTTAVNISVYFKTTGRLITTSTACTSGSMGIGLAYEAIKSGKQTVMIAGGAEEFHPTQVAVFDTLYATSQKNDTPKLTPSAFDKDRDGLVIGEGAAVLILEEMEHAKKRGAKIYAEVSGFATNTDGTHITNPNHETMSKVMEMALEDANVSSDKIGYVNAHGTATIQGDIAESQATYNVFKRKIPISTIKNYTGHTLGACGAIESVLSIEMMNNNWFCPNINTINIDENCAKLDYILGEGQTFSTDYIMSNNFAFGGINTSLIFKKY
ncbi:MAG: beta-ketoacyl-ACP synthase [Candidatus Gastranaerophilaceae bacterium]